VKRVVLLLGLGILVLGTVLVVRTLRIPAPPPAVTEAGAQIAVDEVAAVNRLSGAIRFPTVSYASGGPIDTAAFVGLHQYHADRSLKHIS
jgi:hypothetical protein